jgi:hypothetical protein
MQVIVRHTQFPEGFGQHSRSYALTKLQESFEALAGFEQAIPNHYWVKVDGQIRNQWQEKHRLARLSLREKGIYHATALTLFRKVRCKIDPMLAECKSANRE